MTSPDQNTGMPRRHVVGLGLIAAIAVVLVASIAVRALPLGPDGPATTPGIAQVAAPVTMPSRVIASQAPTPVAPAQAPPAADAPVRLPAPPPPMRQANPRRQIASISERPQPARPRPHRHGDRHRAQQGGPAPVANGHLHPRRPHA